MRITGIDPGLTGAIVTVVYEEGLAVDINVVDLPTIGDKKDKKIDAAALADELQVIQDAGCRHVFMEALHAMPPPQKGRPGRGTVAAWKLALCVGHLEQALVEHHLPHTFVQPQVWKKAMRIQGSGPPAKEQARIRALQLFPEARKHLYRVKDGDRADALLIAEWGRRQLDGQHT